MRPIPLAISAGKEAFGLKPLGKASLDSGNFAISALMYQYGAELNAWWLVALWTSSIAIEVAAEMAAKREARASTKTYLPEVPATPPELKAIQ